MRCPSSLAFRKWQRGSWNEPVKVTRSTRPRSERRSKRSQETWRLRSTFCTLIRTEWGFKRPFLKAYDELSSLDLFLERNSVRQPIRSVYSVRNGGLVLVACDIGNRRRSTRKSCGICQGVVRGREKDLFLPSSLSRREWKLRADDPNGRRVGDGELLFEEGIVPLSARIGLAINQCMRKCLALLAAFTLSKVGRKCS